MPNAQQVEKADQRNVAGQNDPDAPNGGSVRTGITAEPVPQHGLVEQIGANGFDRLRDALPRKPAVFGNRTATTAFSSPPASCRANLLPSSTKGLIR